MSDVSFERDIACERDRIRELLLDRGLLTEFVRLQNPVEDKFSITIDESSSTMDWRVSSEGIPGIFSGFVDKTIPIHLVITPPGPEPDQDGSMYLDLKGKVSGELRASLSLIPVAQDPTHTTMVVRGRLSIHINVPFLSGIASKMARDEMILPILGELSELLEEWCAETPA